MATPVLSAMGQQGATVTVRGVVIDEPSRRPLEGVTIRVGQRDTAVTDSAGGFRIERVEPGRHRLAIERIGYAPKFYQLRLSPSDTEAFINVALEPLPVALVYMRARIDGAVLDELSRRGVQAVQVRVDDSLRATTDARGMFEVRDVTPGLHTLAFHGIGHVAKSIVLVTEWATRRVFLTVPLAPLAFELEPVLVRGDTSVLVVRGRLAEFYRRQQLYGPFGRFLTERDLERRNPSKVSDLFFGIAGAHVDAYGRILFRGSAIGSAAPAGRACAPAVYLDGMFISGTLIDDLVRPEEVAGIEVDRSVVETPLELARVGYCGAIVLWTR